MSPSEVSSRALMARQLNSSTGQRGAGRKSQVEIRASGQSEIHRGETSLFFFQLHSNLQPHFRLQTSDFRLQEDFPDDRPGCLCNFICQSGGISFRVSSIEISVCSAAALDKILFETWNPPPLFSPCLSPDTRSHLYSVTRSRCTKTGRQRAASCSGIPEIASLPLYTWIAVEGFPRSLLSRDGKSGLHWDPVSSFGVDSLDFMYLRRVFPRVQKSRVERTVAILSTSNLCYSLPTSPECHASLSPFSDLNSEMPRLMVRPFCFSSFPFYLRAVR
jgi:hypothetical protein